MVTVSLQEAQATLPELFRRLAPGEELVITDGDRPVARLTPAPPPAPEPPREPRKLGTMRGTVLSMEHFDAPLDDFAESMGCATARAGGTNPARSRRPPR